MTHTQRERTAQPAAEDENPLERLQREEADRAETERRERQARKRAGRKTQPAARKPPRPEDVPYEVMSLEDAQLLLSWYALHAEPADRHRIAALEALTRSLNADRADATQQKRTEAWKPLHAAGEDAARPAGLRRIN